jgi:hypothetical protein
VGDSGYRLKSFDIFDICILVQFYHKHFMINFLTLARKFKFLTSNEVFTAQGWYKKEHRIAGCGNIFAERSGGL